MLELINPIKLNNKTQNEIMKNAMNMINGDPSLLLRVSDMKRIPKKEYTKMKDSEQSKNKTYR